MPWRCEICHVDRGTAERRRARLGQRKLRDDASTCSSECGRLFYLKRQRERFGAGSGYRHPMPRDWTCAVCGRDLESAQHLRKRIGLGSLASGQKTCSPKCSEPYRRAAIQASNARTGRKRTGVRRSP